MQTIKIILASIAFAFYFIEMARIPERLPILKRKPFNCIICLPVYIAAILVFLPAYVTNAVLAIFMAGVLAPFIRNFLHNLMFSK